jgi:hypothetical protein
MKRKVTPLTPSYAHAILPFSCDSSFPCDSSILMRFSRADALYQDDDSRKMEYVQDDGKELN